MKQASINTRPSTPSEVGCVFIIPSSIQNDLFAEKPCRFRESPITHRHVYIQLRLTEQRFRYVVLRGVWYWYCIGIHTPERRNYNFYFQFTAAFAYIHCCFCVHSMLHTLLRALIAIILRKKHKNCEIIKTCFGFGCFRRFS